MNKYGISRRTTFRLTRSGSSAGIFCSVAEIHRHSTEITASSRAVSLTSEKAKVIDSQDSMAGELEIPFSEMRYDITMPFFEGRVKIDGVKLKPTKTSSMVFADYPQLREADFGVCDLNLGYFLPAIDAGWELIGLPGLDRKRTSL